MKGRTNNPNGRPKGTANKATTELRQWIKNLLDDNREQLIKDFKKLDPADRWRVTEKLIQYVTPKMQNVEATIDINALTEEQIDTVVSELYNKITPDNGE